MFHPNQGFLKGTLIAGFFKDVKTGGHPEIPIRIRLVARSLRHRAVTSEITK